MALSVGFFGAGLIANYHAWSLQHGGANAQAAVVFDPVHGRAEAFAERFGARVADREADVLGRSRRSMCARGPRSTVA